ncbi:right-handed parallel beta-helix repeat-containing protein [bacterium]|nr:right-handed parallel beta-helix repeat-containing protein [bacterium]
MSRLLRLALYGVLVVALAGPAMAATYYVSPTGNNANPGTAALPFQTIQHGLTQLAAPGDVLNIGAGTYIGSGTITIAVSGAAGNPIIVQASDAARPVLQNMAFLTTGSYLTFNSLIFDGSLVQESAFDLTRPGTNIVINGCDFMRIVENPLVNSINLSNSGDDVADDSPVRIWGASSVTINDCDFYAYNSPGDYYCIQVVNASGNLLDATGMDLNVLSDLTITNCNNFGRSYFVGVRRPMENIVIENCESNGSEAFFYAREANRIGSRIRQTLSGGGAAPGYPGTTLRNITIRDCSMTCNRAVVIDDASAATSGKAGNYTLQNLTVNVTTQTTSGSSICIQFDHDTEGGLTPSNNGWMGDYENLTLRNITINDPAGGREFNTGVFFGNGSNNAGYFANVVIQNCSWDVLDNAIRTHGFGGRNILIGGSAGTGNSLKTRTTDGIQTNFHTTIAGSRIVDMTVSYNNFNVNRIGLYLYGGNLATGIKAGFQNFWLTNNTIFANTHSGLLIANGASAHAVMRNMVVSGNVIDSSDNNGSGYPLWLWSTHTDADNMSRDWVITGNTVRNNTTNGWGTIRTDGAGFGGKFDITNNTLQCGWFGIVLVGGAGAGLGHNNLTISGNTLYNGYIPPGFTAAQVNLPYGGVDFAATKIINATVVNNTMINLRPVRREEGDRDRNAPIAYEQGTSHSINNLLQNVVYNNNTAIGLWSNALQMDTGYVQNCTVENIIFPLATLHGRLARISNVSLNGLTVRNIDHKNSVFDQDAIWFLNTIGSGPVVLSNLILNCDDQPDHDWAGIWGTNDNAGTQDNVTIKNLVIKNPGGPGILLTNRKTNVRIEECLIINAGAKSQTGPAGNSGWGIQVEGPGNSNYTIVNNAIINASAGIKLEASFSVISGNVIGLRSDTNQSGIVVGGQGNTEVTVRRNGVAGPGVAPGGITDGTGLVILGGFGVISSSISNNTFAGFANGCVVQDGTGVKLWNNAFDKLSGTGLRVTAGSAGTVANFNAYSGAATTYSGIAAGANDVVSGNLRLASYDPTTMNFLLPMSSPPSPLINAGSGDGGSTPDGTTDIGYREGGSIGPTAPAGFSAPYCFLDAVAGNDANDGLTVPTAVQTWAVALTKVPGGGTIYVVSTTPGGVYPAGVVTITNVASQATPLVIRPATGATPVVKERFDLWGTSHVIFDGLTFDAAARHRFNILSGTGSSDLTVRNCIFDNALGGVVRTPGGTLDPPIHRWTYRPGVI